ncbi:hypothetical protein HH239_22800, partial [Escherichia coli]|nr:hypothetical protein [Escherichia coli]
EGCLILLADNNEVQELRRELYQVKQSVKGMRDIWEYTLVLPSEIAESDFSRDIYTYLENVLR